MYKSTFNNINCHPFKKLRKRSKKYKKYQKDHGLYPDVSIELKRQWDEGINKKVILRKKN
jgi:hypothetical protein